MTDLIDGNECTSHISDISKMLIVSCKEKKQQNPQWFGEQYSLERCVLQLYSYNILYTKSYIYFCTVYRVRSGRCGRGIKKNVTR